MMVDVVLQMYFIQLQPLEEELLSVLEAQRAPIVDPLKDPWRDTLTPTTTWQWCSPLQRARPNNFG